ncbi:hypothetical protein PSK87_13130 [Escherichia coli]|nr:hypothetical protein [Escherichia coli]
MAHGVDDFSVNDINRGNLNDPSLQTAGFCIDNAQHGMLQAEKA